MNPAGWPTPKPMLTYHGLRYCVYCVPDTHKGPVLNACQHPICVDIIGAAEEASREWRHEKETRELRAELDATGEDDLGGLK